MATKTTAIFVPTKYQTPQGEIVTVQPGQQQIDTSWIIAPQFAKETVKTETTVPTAPTAPAPTQTTQTVQTTQAAQPTQPAPVAPEPATPTTSIAEPPKTPPNPENPWFGIPAAISGTFTDVQQAKDYWKNLGYTGYDTAATPTPKAGETTTTPTVPTLPTIPGYEDQAIEDYNQLNKDLEDQYNEYNKSLTEISSGNFQLTPEEEGIIAEIRRSMERQLAEQRKVNEAVMGSLTTMGIRAGRQRYAAEIETKSLDDQRNKGLERLRDIEAQGNALILQARQAMKDKRMDALNQAFEQYQQLQKDKSDNILNLLKLEREKERLQLDRLAEIRNQAKADLDFAKSVAPGLASGLISLDDKGEIVMPDIADVYQAAEDAGINPNMLIGEINQRIEQLRKASFEDRKRQLELIKLQAPELRTVGGNLYAISYDKDGKLISTLIQGKPSSGGSSTGGLGKMTDEFRNWYYTTFGEIADPNNRSVQEEWERWKLTGASQRFTVKEEEPENLSKWEVESGVWQWLNTDEAQNMSDSEKAFEIRSAGLNPESFGIYE